MIELKITPQKEMPRNIELILLKSQERHDIIWVSKRGTECA